MISISKLDFLRIVVFKAFYRLHSKQIIFKIFIINSSLSRYERFEMVLYRRTISKFTKSKMWNQRRARTFLQTASSKSDTRNRTKIASVRIFGVFYQIIACSQAKLDQTSIVLALKAIGYTLINSKICYMMTTFIIKKSVIVRVS